MKKNILSLENGKWYKWEEYCDECGNQIRNHERRSNYPPDQSKKDLCLNCLRKLSLTIQQQKNN